MAHGGTSLALACLFMGCQGAYMLWNGAALACQQMHAWDATVLAPLVPAKQAQWQHRRSVRLSTDMK